MGRAPCCEKVGLNRGPWTREEDLLLTQHISLHGEGSWRTLPKAAGLRRCGKSCRLRWINYLRPDLKRGNISEEEDQLIIKLHSLLGNRWSLIAGRLPGRTDNEIKNYWNTHLKKKLRNMGIDPQTHRPIEQAHHDPTCPAKNSGSVSSCNCQIEAHTTSGSTTTMPFSYQKLLGMEYPLNNPVYEAEETLKGPPSSPISILSQGSSMTDKVNHEQSISSAREKNTYSELPSLSSTSDTATSSSCCSTKPGELASLSFEVYPVMSENDHEIPSLFGDVDTRPENVSSSSLLLNIINSDGLWDVEIVRPIEEFDPSMIITEAANTDLWESHYTSCVATGLSGRDELLKWSRNVFQD